MVEIVKEFAKINNGFKYVQLVEKNWIKTDSITGEKKDIHYLSLETGAIMRSDDGTIFYGNPDKKITLPKNPELLHTLGKALLNYPNISNESTKEKKR